jgi:threonine aldolase
LSEALKADIVRAALDLESTIMFFASDNWAGAHPAITAALARHGDGFEPAYGDGTLDRKVQARLSEIFEREVSVFFVGTGTAANSLALALYAKPGSIAFCHSGAHVTEDECGAPEFFSGGSRLKSVEGGFGKFSADALDGAVSRFFPPVVHDGRAAAVTVTQATEAGTVYALDEIATIAEVTKRHGLGLHMDGARFANALVSLDASPAEMTWRRGVDVLSFGGTKNGCWCAEAIVLFDPERVNELAFHRKRGAQLFSKSRFIAAQFDAYLDDDLWLDNARHANAMAATLAEGFRTSRHARLAWEPQANEVFAIIEKDTVERARVAGARFYDWHVPAGFDGAIEGNEGLCRFVTSFATAPEDVAKFADLIG